MVWPDGAGVSALALAAAAVLCGAGAISVVWGGPADDVPRGEAPGLDAVALAAWGVAAIVLALAAVLVWAVRPEQPSLDGDEVLEAWMD